MADRLAALLAGGTLNGIDFVEVADDTQTALVVHFLTKVPVAGTLTGAAAVTITGGESVPTVPVAGPAGGSADWSTDDAGRPLLRLRTTVPGDFSTYRLRIASPRSTPTTRRPPSASRPAAPRSWTAAALRSRALRRRSRRSRPSTTWPRTS